MSLNPESMKPMAMVKVTTSLTIAPILQQVTCRFSPVCSKYTSLYARILFLTFVLENNHHIYVLENSVWDLNGRYNLAFEDNDDLKWVSVNGNNVTSMLVVGNINICFNTYKNFIILEFLWRQIRSSCITISSCRLPLWQCQQHFPDSYLAYVLRSPLPRHQPIYYPISVLCTVSFFGSLHLGDRECNLHAHNA